MAAGGSVDLSDCLFSFDPQVIMNIYFYDGIIVTLRLISLLLFITRLVGIIFLKIDD